MPQIPPQKPWRTPKKRTECRPFLPHEDLDTQLLAGALTELGIGSSTVPWTLVTDRTDADLAVIRTTWDYTSRREEFLGFLESLPMPVVNPSAVARWNSHKGYLAELGAAGVPVVPVTMVAQGGQALIPAVGADRIIVKPAISAGARGVVCGAASAVVGRMWRPLAITASTGAATRAQQI